MEAKTQQAEINISLVHAVLIWLAIYSFELIAGFYLQGTPATEAYYHDALVFTSVLFVITPFLGFNPLVKDILELCFYDILVQILGLLMCVNGASPFIYFMLAQTINLLKVLRLTWPIFSSAIHLPETWPTFGLIGLIGLIWKNKQQSNLPLSSRQKSIMAAMLVAVLIGGYIFVEIRVASKMPVLPFLFFGLAMLVTRPLITRLKNREHEATEAIAHATALEVEAAANKERLKNHAVIEAQKNDLEIANQELKRTIAALAAEKAQVEALSAERAAISADLTERNTSLRDASHDFKVPLLRLTSLLDQAQDYATHDKQINLLEQLDKGIEEVRSMMGDLIEQAKTSTDLTTPALQHLQISDLGDYLHTRLHEPAQKRGVSFEVKTVNVTVLTQAIPLRRIIINLANNAILYAHEGTRVTVRFHNSPTRCYVRVYDTGTGIPDANGTDRAANFARLIETLKQRRQPITPNPAQAQGHGLGLQIVQRLCGEIGSTITLQSIPGMGTCFRFSLPLAD